MPVLRNPRWERFAQELAKGKTADEAYVLAGYQENRCNASRLKANENILDRVQELLGQSAKRAIISVESVTESLMRIAKQAEAIRDAAGLSVARAAHMDAAKLNGLIVDRSENVNVNHEVSAEMPTEAEWEAEHSTAH
jgi:phage terminase small subunit